MFSLLVVSAALAQQPAPVDVSAYSLKVATDGKKHVFAWDPKALFNGALFVGDEKTLYRVPVRGGGSSDDRGADAYFWEPRLSGNAVAFAPAGRDELVVTCRSESPTTLHALADDEAKAVLAKVAFVGRRFLRQPERLMRDDSGKYYFIDRLRSNDERRDFRLFIGARGKMKLQSLKDVVDDSEGMIFSTKSGELRLITGKNQKWVEGKKELPLVDVPLDDGRNVRLVYNELGVYDGQPLGTPCDDLP